MISALQQNIMAVQFKLNATIGKTKALMDSLEALRSDLHRMTIHLTLREEEYASDDKKKGK